MGVRELFRGTVGWDHLEEVALEIARRYGQDDIHVEFLEANNWLSTPFVVNDRLFVKVISRQNSLVHALFTGARNLGAFSSGTEGFFERFATPLQMAEHELEATARMRAIGINTPEPIEAFAVGDLGIVVLEYLPAFRTLDDLEPADAEPLAPALFEALSTMHEHGLVHGDLRSENVLIYEGELYLVDATNVRENAVARARSYDLACALAALEPVIGSRVAVGAAADHYSPEALLEAREFLDFVNLRPDHDFDAAGLKGEIEKHADVGPAPDRS